MIQYVLLISINGLSQVKIKISYWFGRNKNSSAMILTTKIHLIFDWHSQTLVSGMSQSLD